MSQSHSSKTTPALLHLYLQEIGRTPLLTSQEEKQLATRIQQEGDKEARDHMIQANLKLVVSIAKQYAPSADPEMLLDLIQEGSLGLIKAIERFDPSYDTRFSTYAVYWIKQAVLRALKNSYLVHIPENVIDQIYHLRKVREHLSQKLGKEPSMEDIAREMEITVEKAKQLDEVVINVVSLSTPVGNEESSESGQLQEVIEDTSAPAVSERVEQQYTHENVTDAIATLPPRERSIIEQYYGLADGMPHTLDEIGKRHRISRERVRQIRNIGIARLKSRPDVWHKLFGESRAPLTALSD